MRYWLASLTAAILVALCGMGCSNRSNPKDAGIDKDTKIAKDGKPKDPANPTGSPKLPTKEESVVQKTPVKQDPSKEEPKTVVPPKKTPVKEPEKEKVATKEVAVTEPPTKTKETIKDLPPKETKTKEREKDKGSKGTPTEPSEVGGKDFKFWKNKLKTATDPGEHEDALKALCLFGPTASYTALPDIISDLKRPALDLSVRVNGIMALSTALNQAWQTRENGPSKENLDEAQKLYKRYLNDSQVIMRVRTLQGLPALGEKNSRALIKDVIKLCKDPETWEVRKEAVLTLVQIAGPDGKSTTTAEAITQLKGGLGGISDPSYYVRQTAIQGLAVLCQKSGNVPIELYNVSEKGIYDKREEVRLASLHALAALKGEFDNPQTKKILLARLNDRTASEKNAVLNIWTHAAIMTINGNPAGPHMDAILKKLADPEATTKVQGLSAIASFGEKANKPAVLKAVLPLLDDKEVAVANTALATTVQLHHFPPVIVRLKDKTPEVRHNSLQLISGIGPAAKKECGEPVLDVVKQAGVITANAGLTKEEMEKEVTVGEAAIATLVNLHCFETVPFLQNITADKKITKDLREAARDALDDFKKIQKELKEKTK